MSNEHPNISNHQEELNYLRKAIAEKEKEIALASQVMNKEEVAHEKVQQYQAQGSSVHSVGFETVSPMEAMKLALNLDASDDDATMNELRTIMEERGIQSAFAVLKQLNNPHLTDDFHRFLVAYILAGYEAKGAAKEKDVWKALHMTLYQVSLPEALTNEEKQEKSRSLKELISSMEQFYEGMLSIESSYTDEPPYMSFELGVPDDKAHLNFYVSVPRSRAVLFEKQILAIFPTAKISVEKNDYNVFTQEGTSLGSYAQLKSAAPIPFKTYVEFDYDPINTILNSFSRISAAGEGASLQILFKPRKDYYIKLYKRMIKSLGKGEDSKEVFKLSDDFWSELKREARLMWKEMFATEKKKEGSPDQKNISHVERKIQTPIVETNIRIVTSAGDAALAKSTLEEIEAAFNQFADTNANGIKFVRPKGKELATFFKQFSYRVFSHQQALPLSIRELTTLYHFPPKGIVSSPHLQQSRFKSSEPPIVVEKKGLLLGRNEHRGINTDIYMYPNDRLRHMYVVGQTGTGKSHFMRYLIDQDIRNGEGVCFIDPHGTDIVRVLGSIPPHRFKDVIYFDPSNMERPFGINMLEYDPKKPEQKSFIVNELMAIFRQLYGDIPESMGPAFEQYFRNATQLVMEDPESGSVMADIQRVMADPYFRNLKLAKSKNFVVNQFWTDIATQVEGENSLQNIIPYITNKFDDFVANDFMRPIMGQQKSSFDFREVMDQKKILLVNLSKGRLGERNANLLGLIIVGKLFMAALSRVDNPRADYPPFYLYIDEFQNITTKSIPGILSEARKYKLSLTLAHQYIKQIDEKIRDAVFGNVGSMAVFRVGDDDAQVFEKLFNPSFSASDFANIPNRNAYIRLLMNETPQKPFNIETYPMQEPNFDQVDDLRELSALTYGRDRATVEADILKSFQSYH
jgi:hypothetical protein